MKSSKGRRAKLGPLKTARAETCRVLGEQVSAERKRRGLTLSQVAEGSGVNRSTIYRLETNGSCIDADPEIKLRRWLGLPLTIGAIASSGDTLTDIRAVIHADPNLDSETADALSELMEHAYRKLTTHG